MKSSD